ncbi:MAG: two-component system, NtrC family, sensor histidine kinase KinB, partial [Blastocatellia bacterium]
MNSLRAKLAFGYGLIILMLSGVSAWSIYHLVRLGRAELPMLATSALALVLAFVFAWRFTRYVSEPIATLTEKARRIGEGDFDQHIHISSRDEIGVLADEFDRMLVRLRELRRSDYGRLLLEQKKADAVIDSLYEPVIVTDARGHVI